MNKFSYLDYRSLLRDLLGAMGAAGRGQHSKLARHMQVHATFITHLLRGKNDLSPEQALKVASFFSLTPLETDYIFNLVQWNRAGDQGSKEYFEGKVNEIRAKGSNLKEQLKKQTSMTLENQAIFYSDWTYSAVRLASALPEGKSVDRVAKLLNLPRDKVGKIVEFLVAEGLCKIEKDRLSYGVFATYVDSSSPFAKKLHDNWRLRSVQLGSTTKDDLMYTSAVTLTLEDFLSLRDLLLEALKKFEKVTDESKPELLAYLNLDWVKIT